MADTHVIRKVAIGTEALAVPTLPNVGSSIDWTASALVAWTTCGSIRALSDDCDLDENSVEISTVRNLAEVMPPLSLTREDLMILNNGIEQVGFTCYGTRATVIGLDSTIAAVGNVQERGATLTWKSLLVEIKDKGFDYYPSVAIFLDGHSGSVSEVVKAAFVCIVRGTTTIPSGHQWHNYPAA